MAKQLQLEIVTPEALKYEGSATVVGLPGAEGDMAVLAMHAPLVAMLRPGELMYRSDQGEFHMATAEGFATVAENKVVVLVDAALTPAEIKKEVASKRKDEVEALLQKEPAQAERLRGELAWALAQMRVADRGQ